MKKLLLTVFIVTCLGIMGCSSGETAEVNQQDIPSEDTAGVEQEDVEETDTDESMNDTVENEVIENATEAVDETATEEPVEVTSEEWKAAYLPIVEQWDSVHSGDYEYGYNLIYLNDDDIPELVLSCDDEAFAANDIYTYIDGAAVRLVFEGNEDSTEYLSFGRQGKMDEYVEKTGIYIQGSAMMGSSYTCGYLLDGSAFKNIFTYSYNDVSWDETAENPYSFEVEYIDAAGGKVNAEAVVNEDEKYFSIEGAEDEATEIEEIYNFSFADKKMIEATMNYDEICEMLTEE